MTDTLAADGSDTTAYPDGSSDTLLLGPDPRWGMLSPITTSHTIRMPSGLAHTVTTSRTITLSDPTNPLSLTQETTTIAENGRTYSSVFNAASNTITSTSPAGRQTTTTYNHQGDATNQQVSGITPIATAYNGMGLVTQVTQGTRSWTYAYDPLNRLTSARDPLHQTTAYSYDAADRVTQVTLPDARQILFSYDANGNTTSVTPPGRTAHTFTYNSVDQPSSSVPPTLGGTNSTQYTYNFDRQPTQIDLPDGTSITFGYDSAGRMGSVTIPRGTFQFGYDAATGNLSGVTAPGGIGLAYSYDGSLPTDATWSGSVAGSVAETYDSTFRVTSQSVDGGNTASYSYDNDDLVTQAGGLELTYNAQNGLLTGTTLGNLTDAQSYDGFAQPTQYTASYNGAAIYADSHTYDALGRITARVETIGGSTTTYGYGYDTRGRLTTVTKNGNPLASYTYDANGNRLSGTDASGTKNGTYDAQDRLTHYGSTAYTYGATGNLQTTVTAGQTTSYTYDQLGNLTGATLPNATQIGYVIDGENRRIGKTVNGILVQGFLYQNTLSPVAELDGSGNVVSRFVYAQDSNVPEYMIKGGETYRIITDHLGSPRLVVDVATGAVAQRMDYDAFGTVTQDTNPGFQPFGFAGGLYDRDTKLVRFGARDYDAATGRWTAKDPIGFDGMDTNLYAYTHGDPVNFLDPTGQNFLEWLIDKLLEKAKDHASEELSKEAAKAMIQDQERRDAEQRQRDLESINSSNMCPSDKAKARDRVEQAYAAKWNQHSADERTIDNWKGWEQYAWDRASQSAQQAHDATQNWFDQHTPLPALH
jgi:RHS repeat-associated protein